MKKLTYIIAAFICIAVVAKAGQYSMESLGFIAPQIIGKSNVFNPQTGELLYDSSDATFYGRDHLSNWIPLGGTASVVPAGSVLTFAGATCPTGYLAANGAAVSRTTYDSLFSVIGTTHGAGDGSSTFNLPDYRGRFLRGVDDGTGRDPDSSSRAAMNTGGLGGNNVGSVQGDGFKSHTHIQNSHTHTQDPHKHQFYGALGGGSASRGANGSIVSGASTQITRYGYAISADPLGDAMDNTTATNQNTTATNQNTGGNETRPTNAYVNFCIKY